ncbi:hypothetical protein Tco_0000422 [Tanacetum coccineum]
MKDMEKKVAGPSSIDFKMFTPFSLPRQYSRICCYHDANIVETDKVNHTVETDMVKLVVEIKCFGMSFDEFDKETGSSDGLQPKQVDLSCVHALNEPHLHEIHVVPIKHEAAQC